MLTRSKTRGLDKGGGGTSKPPRAEAIRWNVFKQYHEGDADFYNTLISKFGPLGDLEMWGKAFVKSDGVETHGIHFSASEVGRINLAGTRMFYEHRYNSNNAMSHSNDNNAGNVLPQSHAMPVGIITRSVCNPNGEKGPELWVHGKFSTENLDMEQEKELRDKLRSNEISDLSICYVEQVVNGDGYKSRDGFRGVAEVSVCNRGRLPETHIIAVAASDSKYDSDNSTSSNNNNMADTTTLSLTKDADSVNLDEIAPMNVESQDKPNVETDASAGSAPEEKKAPETGSKGSETADTDPMKLILDRLAMMEKSTKSQESENSELRRALQKMVQMQELQHTSGDSKEKTPQKEMPKESAAAPPEKPNNTQIEAALQKQQEDFQKRNDATAKEVAELRKQLLEFSKRTADQEKQRIETRASTLQARAAKCDIPMPANPDENMLNHMETIIAKMEDANKQLAAEKKRSAEAAASSNKAAMSTAVNGIKRPISEISSPHESATNQKPAKNMKTGGANLEKPAAPKRSLVTAYSSNSPSSKEVLLIGLQESGHMFPESIFNDDTILRIAFSGTSF